MFADASTVYIITISCVYSVKIEIENTALEVVKVVKKSYLCSTVDAQTYCMIAMILFMFL